MPHFFGSRRALFGGEAVAAAAGAGTYDAIANIVHIYEPGRRALTAYTGNLLRLRRASDNGESNFTYDANGHLDTTAIAAWAGGASYVVTIYDQKGGDDITQATEANQPLFTASAQNSHAGMTFDGTNDKLQGAFTIGGALSQPFNVYGVAQLDVTAVNDDNTHIIWDGDDLTKEMSAGTLDAPNPDIWNIRSGANLASVAASDALWKVWAALFNGVSSVFWHNNVSMGSGNAGADNADGLTMGARSNATRLWKGNITSVIVCDPSHSTAQREAMQTAINAYWAVY